jgi:hypothetical protein
MERFPKTFNAQYYQQIVNNDQEKILSDAKLEIYSKVDADFHNGKTFSVFSINEKLTIPNQRKLAKKIHKKFPQNLYIREFEWDEHRGLQYECSQCTPTTSCWSLNNKYEIRF